jgi:hypothetical protein
MEVKLSFSPYGEGDRLMIFDGKVVKEYMNPKERKKQENRENYIIRSSVQQLLVGKCKIKKGKFVPVLN